MAKNENKAIIGFDKNGSTGAETEIYSLANNSFGTWIKANKIAGKITPNVLPNILSNLVCKRPL